MSPKKPPEHLTILGPMWQFECQRCGEVADDVYDSKAEAEEAASVHDCIADRPMRLRRRPDGSYVGRVGDPFVGYLVVTATVHESEDGDARRASHGLGELLDAAGGER